MIKRFLFSILMSMIFIIPITLLNLTFILTTPLEMQTPAQRFNATFTIIMTLEITQIFTLAFIIVSEYYKVHPEKDKKLILQTHHEQNPDIPKEYYRDPKTGESVDD